MAHRGRVDPVTQERQMLMGAAQRNARLMDQQLGSRHDPVTQDRQRMLQAARLMEEQQRQAPPEPHPPEQYTRERYWAMRGYKLDKYGLPKKQFKDQRPLDRQKADMTALKTQARKKAVEEKLRKEKIKKGPEIGLVWNEQKQKLKIIEKRSDKTPRDIAWSSVQRDPQTGDVTYWTATNKDLQEGGFTAADMRAAGFRPPAKKSDEYAQFKRYYTKHAEDLVVDANAKREAKQKEKEREERKALYSQNRRYAERVGPLTVPMKRTNKKATGLIHMGFTDAELVKIASKMPKTIM